MHIYLFTFIYPSNPLWRVRHLWFTLTVLDCWPWTVSDSLCKAMEEQSTIGALLGLPYRRNHPQIGIRLSKIWILWIRLVTTEVPSRSILVIIPSK